MKERLSFSRNLTREEEDAKAVWDDVLVAIKEAGKDDILKNAIVFDVGGGMGELSKYLNAQGVRCISLDVKNLDVDASASPVRGDAHQMPFADNSFSIVHGRGIFDSFIYEHDFPKLVGEIARVLKRGGILSVYDPDPPPTQEMQKHFKLLTPDGTAPTLWEKM